jgi:hypothetical protein
MLVNSATPVDLIKAAITTTATTAANLLLVTTSGTAAFRVGVHNAASTVAINKGLTCTAGTTITGPLAMTPGPAEDFRVTSGMVAVTGNYLHIASASTAVGSTLSLQSASATFVGTLLSAAFVAATSTPATSNLLLLHNGGTEVFKVRLPNTHLVLAST